MVHHTNISEPSKNAGKIKIYFCVIFIITIIINANHGFHI